MMEELSSTHTVPSLSGGRELSTFPQAAQNLPTTSSKAQGSVSPKMWGLKPDPPPVCPPGTVQSAGWRGGPITAEVVSGARGCVGGGSSGSGCGEGMHRAGATTSQPLGVMFPLAVHPP